MASSSNGKEWAPLSIADLENYARQKLNKGIWAYYYHGAGDEITRVDNSQVFNRFAVFNQGLQQIENKAKSAS
jgi:isopentenyl diphosphate isomerase/L-lactate dehydrogenase-like FMN-dependent dehydrogenase